MTDTAVLPRIYTVSEFEAFADHPDNADRRFELVHGEIVEKVPTEEHAIIAATITYLLVGYVRTHKIGRVGVEPRHRAEADDYNARIPDVAFTSFKRSLPVTKQGSVPQMPDLAVEVKSPSDRVRDMREKAEFYLRNGAVLVWLVYPASQSIEVCTLNNAGAIQFQTLSADDVLDGGETLPQFQVAVRELFEME